MPARRNMGRVHAARDPKDPAAYGGDYDKIREEMMKANGGPISNTINFLSQNTFGMPAEGTRMRAGLDAVAGLYRAFLDALPYRRQDGRVARAIPKGRAANAFVEWEAFKRGVAGENDESAVVGGREALLRGEKEVMAYWEGVSEEGKALVKARKKAPNGVALVGDTRLIMSEGQCRALAGDTMALVLALRRAAATAPASALGSARVTEREQDFALVDASAQETGDYREELLSGWGGGGNNILFSGGYGAITPDEAAEVEDASKWTPVEMAKKVKAISALLLCTPTDAITVCHRFPGVLETPQSIIASRLAALKELLPRADAAVIFRAEPRLLLAGDGEEILANIAKSVATIRSELPGINADKLVEIEPRMMFEDISEGLTALRELWPEEAFRTSDEENPFFAEELALAIKALQGKGKEKPFKPL